MGGSPYSDNSQSSYDNNMPQQSPDPQGLANMNIASPIGIQSPDPTIESILGTEHGGGAAAAAKIRWQEIGQGSGTGVGLQRGCKADGAAAVEHAAHAEHQQHVVNGGREVHQRRLARPLRCPQELPRGQPAVKKSLRVGMSDENYEQPTVKKK